MRPMRWTLCCVSVSVCVFWKLEGVLICASSGLRSMSDRKVSRRLNSAMFFFYRNDDVSDTKKKWMIIIKLDASGINVIFWSWPHWPEITYHSKSCILWNTHSHSLAQTMCPNEVNGKQAQTATATEIIAFLDSLVSVCAASPWCRHLSPMHK